MITTTNVKSMEMVTTNSVNTKPAEENKAGDNDFQELINKVTTAEKQDNQEKPVVKQDSKEEKKNNQEVKELMPGEVIPLMDLLVENPVTTEHLQTIINDIPMVPGIAQTEGDVDTTTDVATDKFPETALVNPIVDKPVTEEKSSVLQTVHNQIPVETVLVKEPTNSDLLTNKSNLAHTENINQHLLNQSSQAVNEIPSEVVKTGNSEIVSSLPKVDIQPRLDKINQDKLIPKSQISTTEPQIIAEKANIVEKPQTILKSVDIQQATETIVVEKPVTEQVLTKAPETPKLQTEELQTTINIPTTEKTEEREVDLGSVLQQEKASLTPFKEDIIKVKLAEPFKHLNAENVKKIADKITESMNNGRREFHIQMDPENLGKIQVKISLLETGIKVTLSCESQKTYQLLAERANGINQIVEQNTGSQSIIEVKEGYWNQQKDATDQHGRQQRQESQQQEKASKDETNDFIQQMRLGFFDKGLVV